MVPIRKVESEGEMSVQMRMNDGCEDANDTRNRMNDMRLHHSGIGLTDSDYNIIAVLDQSH